MTCGRVLVVDDDDGIRQLITTLLARAGLESYEAASSDEALLLADRDRPVVAVVDVDLGGGGSGYELGRELRDRFDGIPIVFISGVRTESFDRVAGLLLGAQDYIVKPFDPDELIVRIRNLALRSPNVMVDEGLEPSESFSSLTPREREVLRLLARGLSQTQIADELVVSPKTVASHIQKVLAKLDLRSRAAAVAFAHREGLVENGRVEGD